MLTRADAKPLSIAAATALVAGLTFGAWAGPPRSLSEPAYTGEPQLINADDPNLARYKKTIAEQGGPGPLYLVTGYEPGPPSPAPLFRDDSAQLEAELARQSAAFEAQNKVWEAERVAWLESRRQEQQAQVRLPIAYVQAEQVTTAPAPAPGPEEAADEGEAGAD